MPDLMLPDETVYSLLARKTQDFDPTTTTRLIHELVGSESKLGRIPLIFPPALFSVLGFVNARSALSKHTLLPYYCSFMPTETRLRLIGRLASEPELIFSVAKGDYLESGRPVYLRYCRDCARHDRVNHGVTYWHRAHQLPGCDRCLKHQGMLYHSHVREVAPGRYSLVAADVAVRLETRHKRCHPLMGARLAARVGKRSAAVVTSGFTTSLFVHPQVYAGKLRALGFEVNGSVDVQRVGAAFAAFAAEHRIRLDAISAGSWWKSMHVKRRAGWHSPIRHLLFQEFLGWFDQPLQETL